MSIFALGEKKNLVLASTIHDFEPHTSILFIFKSNRAFLLEKGRYFLILLNDRIIKTNYEIAWIFSIMTRLPSLIYVNYPQTMFILISFIFSHDPYNIEK